MIKSLVKVESHGGVGVGVVGWSAGGMNAKYSTNASQLLLKATR